MKFKKLLALGAALVFSVAFIAGCGSNNSDNGAKKELSYSKSQGPYSELFEFRPIYSPIHNLVRYMNDSWLLLLPKYLISHDYKFLS